MSDVLMVPPASRRESREDATLAEQKPIRVAIVGGGCGSITTAFELTRPEHRGKYQVTVYQLGWRLGGKGASGRGPAARIEEHGFHVWMGFYENAFRLMRECYAELDRDPEKCRIAGWRDAFFPAPFIALAQRCSDDSYSSFLSYFPPGEGLPGDPLTENNPFSVSAYMVRAANLVRMMLLRVPVKEAEPSTAWKQSQQEEGFADAHSAFAPDASATAVRARIDRLMKYGWLTTIAGLVEAMGIVELILGEISPYSKRVVLGLLEAILASARQQFEALIRDDPEMLSLWHAVELSLIGVLGVVRFGLISDPRGFDAINDYDFREWMKINGASESTLNSSLLRGSYDLMFAYEDGDYGRPRHGAGAALRGALRMLFSYRGAIVWKMTAGMGDVVFAPFYEVLRKRGVTFKFFHRLKNVRLSDLRELAPGEHSYVKALEFDIQAKTKKGQEYRPLVDVEGLPCWPSKPDYSQLIDGGRFEHEQWKFESHWDRRKVGTRTLRVIDDFDFVVLGVGFGAIPHVCRDLIQRDERWRHMVANIKTIETQAFQIWMREDMETLGWAGPPVSLSGYVHPFETWADMGHLVREELWPANPGAIAYFCSALTNPDPPTDLSDPDYPERRREQVRTNAIRFLNNHIGLIWPKAVRGSGEFRWDLLMDPSADGGARAQGESLFDSQFWIANIDPSERYVLSVPGSQKYRISPLDNTYDNLTIAGDWTASGLDSGCVESAVMSGRLAAHAISSLPALEDIVGYDHP